MKLTLPGLTFHKEYFLLLLPVFFVFHGFVEYYPAIKTVEALKLGGTYLLGITTVTILLSLVMPSWRHAAIFGFMAMSLYLFFGPLHDQVKKGLPGSFFASYKFILPFMLLVLTTMFLLVRRKQNKFNKLTRYLNLVLIFLIAVDLVFLVTKMVTHQEREISVSLLPKPCDTCARPDIYLIISDEYAGNTQLKENFGYDNSGFEKELELRDFQVIKNSKSNYNSTPFSVASLLTMDYMDPLPGKKFDQKDINKITAIINQARVVDYFKLQGYRIRNYSTFNIDGKVPLAETKFLPAKIKLISGQTLLSRLNRDIRFNLIRKLKWKSEMERLADERLDGIEKLYQRTFDEVSMGGGPKFVYTHLLMPHYPYFYDSAGNKNSIETIMNNVSGKKEYIQYLQYSNRKFLHLIDHIRQKSPALPVIIFLSDHGFRQSDNQDELNYHFYNINAIHLPGKNYNGFYEGMTNVNLFRVVLNTMFNQQMSLLKDSTIFLRE